MGILDLGFRGWEIYAQRYKPVRIHGPISGRIRVDSGAIRFTIELCRVPEPIQYILGPLWASYVGTLTPTVLLSWCMAFRECQFHELSAKGSLHGTRRLKLETPGCKTAKELA